MIITLLLFAIALLFLLFVIRYAPWTQGTPNPEDPHRTLEPVSVPALMNLIDARNVDFLRRSLPPAEFRRAQSERNRALRSYVRRIANNTRLLIAVAETIQRADDPAVAESGRALLASAVSTRTRAMKALASTYVGEIFPSFVPDLAGAIQTYESAAARMTALKSSPPSR